MTASTAPSCDIGTAIRQARTHLDELSERDRTRPDAHHQAAEAALDRAGLGPRPPGADDAGDGRLELLQSAVVLAGSLVMVGALAGALHPAVGLPVAVRWLAVVAAVGAGAWGTHTVLARVTVQHVAHRRQVRLWVGRRHQVARLLADGVAPQTAVEVLLRAERERLDPAVVVDFCLANRQADQPGSAASGGARG